MLNQPSASTRPGASTPKPGGALVIGEALVDVVPADQGARELPGGSPLNVAVGLGRLGRSVTLATWLGEDNHGALITEHLRRSGVVLSPGSDAADHTSSARVSFDQAGSGHYVFDLAWDLPAMPADLAPLTVHVGSLGATVSPGGRKVLATVLANPWAATITYDPNVRPQLMGAAAAARPEIEAYVGAADVVKASHEDLEWLYPDRSALESARSWLGMGPDLVVVTMGAQGALALGAADRSARIGVTPGPVADTVGAGDSFMSALIHWLWEEDLLGPGRQDALRHLGADQLQRLLAFASAAAAITVSRPGAEPPWLHELPAPS
ncbi:MAG: PfkB family carbohydrate kinase [Bifidobacteriaceae bacterium]|jgi:fructokinase|nr:PfkB family carbohydrate kinase [Bifidobacteriaceae bacterium]